ncbi:hypothetical protein [Hyphomicrobium methylovorum]|uniref:hypothetical protein n=1 Tax=Hyphomicrobium methylovorum TaxID=84 RepID=UPI0015E70A69|nr:hypothetical protein [Hyphomicrobium methylovorum]
MSNTLTMILVLGGTLVVAIALLYASLTQERPRSRRSEREAAATAAMIAARDRDARE